MAVSACRETLKYLHKKIFGAKMGTERDLNQPAPARLGGAASSWYFSAHWSFLCSLADARCPTGAMETCAETGVA